MGIWDIGASTKKSSGQKQTSSGKEDGRFNGNWVCIVVYKALNMSYSLNSLYIPPPYNQYSLLQNPLKEFRLKIIWQLVAF